MRWVNGVGTERFGKMVMKMRLDGLPVKKVYTAEEQEHIIRHIDGTMALEGMALTDDDKAALRRIASGESTVDEEVQRVVSEYRKIAAEKGWKP